MKTTIQILTVIAALAFTGATASADPKCCPSGSSAVKGCSAENASGRTVVLDGKKVLVADCKFTRGVRSVRMVKVRN